MIPLWLGKVIATRAIKAIKYRIDLKKIDNYVNKPNELDIQMKQFQKNNTKLLKENEEMQKDIALLRSSIKGLKKILNKLQKRR